MKDHMKIDMKNKSPYLMPGLFFAIALVYLDQLTKWLVFEKVLRQDGQGLGWVEWMTTRMPSDDILEKFDIYKQVVLTSFMNFTMVWNKGVSFGMFAGDTELGKYILIGVAIVISTVMLGGLLHAVRALPGYSFALVIGGAIGNVIDRLRFGAVADFVDIHVMGYHWPAFNLADSCIVLGAILLIVDAVFFKDHPHVEAPKNEQTNAGVVK